MSRTRESRDKLREMTSIICNTKLKREGGIGEERGSYVQTHARSRDMLSNRSTRDAQGREHVTRRTDAQMQAHNRTALSSIRSLALERL